MVKRVAETCEISKTLYFNNLCQIENHCYHFISSFMSDFKNFSESRLSITPLSKTFVFNGINIF